MYCKYMPFLRRVKIADADGDHLFGYPMDQTSTFYSILLSAILAVHQTPHDDDLIDSKTTESKNQPADVRHRQSDKAYHALLWNYR